MAAARGKRFALLTAGVGIVVLVAAGIVTAPRLREQWYLWKLESQDDATRVQAAFWLFENGSPDSKAHVDEVMKPWDRVNGIVHELLPISSSGATTAGARFAYR
jgi:hypothetical protein